MRLLLFCDLGLKIRASFDTFMYTICSCIYGLIIDLYNAFDILCQGRLLDNELMQAISFRVGLILGLLMFFRVIFSCVQYLINPETVTDKEKGAFNLVKNILIVIVLLGTYSYIFDFSFKVQNLLLGKNDGNVNVISRLLLPEVVDSDNFGGHLSSQLFLSFYNVNNKIPVGERDSKYNICVGDISLLEADIIEHSDFSIGYDCLDDKYVIGKYRIINFNLVLAPVVGIFVAWVLLMYCLSVGVRVVQFAFLEIIAPVAIISNLSPGKDNAFQKWVKMCTVTYFDVFIRVAIINFIVLVIANVINGYNSSSGAFFESMLTFGNPELIAESMWFIKIVIILALLTFAKKAPELIKELLPKSITASGDFGFSLKKRLDNMVGGNFIKNLPSRAIGYGVGGLVGGTMSAISRFNANMNAGNGVWKSLGAGAAGLITGGVSTAFRATKKGNPIKNISTAYKKRVEEDDRYTALVNDGGSTIGKWKTAVTGAFTETKAQRVRRLSKESSDYAGFLGNIKKYANSFDYVSKLEEQHKVAVASGDQVAAKAAETKLKQARKGAATYAMQLMDGIDIAELEYVGNNSKGEFQFADKNGNIVLSSKDDTVLYAYDFTHDIQPDGTVINHLDGGDKQYISAIQAEVRQKEYDANNVESLNQNSGILKKTRTYNEVQSSSGAAADYANTVIPENIRQLEAEDRAARVRPRHPGGKPN